MVDDERQPAPRTGDTWPGVLVFSLSLVAVIFAAAVGILWWIAWQGAGC
jgi:hypothetical protein